MKRKFLSLSFLLVLMLSLNVNAATYTFNINFDGIFDDVLTEPYVAEGTFIFEHNDTSLDGSYLLSNMTSYNFIIEFWDSADRNNILYTFTTNELIPNTDSSTVDVGIVFSAGDFITFETAPDTTSSYGGSLEFFDTMESTPGNDVVLVFGDSANPNRYIMYNGVSPQYYGEYGSTAVPVPAALWLFGSGIAGLALLRRRF